jgi:deazaflavin-dependent oxidoreductase (nitroreductase family)
MPADPRDLADEEFCYLTTSGRVTGRPHEIEIWFALEDSGGPLYLLSGGHDRSDWVKNLRRNPEVTVRIDGEYFGGRARFLEDEEEDELARHLLVEKYERNPGSLATWRRTALPVAVDLTV